MKLGTCLSRHIKNYSERGTEMGKLHRVLNAIYGNKQPHDFSHVMQD